MEKLLRLYIYVDGVNDTPFPQGAEEPIEIGIFRYDAKRMGGAPTITASVNYPSCLDNEWTDKVYAEFNGEKYYLKQIPTSSYDNADVMYKHDLELVSERVILDNVYFFDTVVGDPQGEDKPVSNSTKVVFFGDIDEFVARLNASLEYSGLDYEVVVDDEITTEEKLMSFEDQFFSNVLQEIYNTYEVPYYFDGKTIHIGYAKSDVIVPDLSYGVDNALLSITKNNANYKTVNRATGYGSSENLTFYYPNNSPKGDVIVETSREGLEVIIVDYERFCDNVDENKDIKFLGHYNHVGDVSYEIPENIPKEYSYGELIITEAREIRFITNVKSDGKSILHYTPTFTISQLIEEGKGEEDWDEGSALHDTSKIVAKKTIDLVHGNNTVVWYKDFYSNDEPCDIEIPYEGDFKVVTTFYWNHPFSSNFKHSKFFIYLRYEAAFESLYGWYYDDKRVTLSSLGLAVSGSTDLEIGDTIIQRLGKYVNTSKNLMPSIYRKSDGAERFYNAINYPFLAEEGYELKYGEYLKKEDGEGNTTNVDYVHNDAYKNDEGEYIHFDYPYVEGKAKEHIVAVEDLKPTIEKAVNSMGLRMDMFSEFAYDDDDNDETEENEDGSDRDFVHSYFFGKLRKMDFNLFECAIEQQPMTISFTSGDCGACNFEIGVTEEFPQKNPVMVNPDGTLMRDANGRVVCGQFEPIYENEIQDRQQDTINNEVWIALRKEEDTYGILMPKAPVNGVGGHRPKACTKNEDGTYNNDGDTFVILGINLPEEYVTRQERQLEKEIIKYIKDNNEEKFTFSIGFSRIYFAENETILKNLSENSKVRIFYNNLPYDLYVSSFSYNMSEGDVLPDIRVELDDTLKVSQNALQNAISQVKSELGRALNNIDVVGIATPYFLRKDVDDEVIGRVNFRKGIKFGEGGKVEIFDNNSAKLTIEYLEVTKKASFTSLEIQEKTHVGGQILVTPAAINCGEVEEFEGFYRCYFQTKGIEGDEIFNQFATNDQAICQTYNTWGSRYYWRKVVGVGEDYIDLSKVEGEYDEDSDAPMAGDKIIQLGNQTDATRQNAIVIAAYGDGSPYIIQYKGINSFEIGEDKIVTKLSSTENIFTGKVHMEMGSDGFENVYADINIGGHNLLRNSGFTGDYLSEDLVDDSVLDSVNDMFNPPLVHWHSEEHPSVNAVVQDSDESMSGKEVVLTNGSIYQELYFNLLPNSTYMLSFKAKGNTLTFSVGGVTKTITLTEEWHRYAEKIETTENGVSFAISNATCSLCEIKLEQGTVVTAWSQSLLDNSSDRTYYESLKYLDIALGGATDVLGGLVLTNHIKVGDNSNNTPFVEKGGMNGSHVDDNSPAFWAGGDFDTARTTAQKYKTNTTTPTGEIPFVVTHGGKVVLNDAVVRGTVYAKDGSFEGEVNAHSGVFNDVDIQTGKIANFNINGNSLGIQEEVGGNGMSLYDKYISFYDKDTREKQRTLLARIGAYEGVDAYDHVAEFKNESTNVLDTMGGVGYGIISNVSGYTSSYAFASEKGVFAGLRPNVTILGSDNSPLQLGKYDHTVLALYGGRIILDSNPENGQEYEFILPHTSASNGNVEIVNGSNKQNIYLMYDGVKRTGFSPLDLGGTRQTLKMVYVAQDDTWFVWHNLY